MMRMRALLAGKRYYADPQYQGVLLFPIEGTDGPISVAYSDSRLQLEPSWWQWHQPLRPRALAWGTAKQEVTTS